MIIQQIIQEVNPIENNYDIHINIQEVIKYIQINFPEAEILPPFEGYTSWELKVNSPVKLDFSRYYPFLNINIINNDDDYFYLIEHKFTNNYQTWFDQQQEYPNYWKLQSDPSKAD
jgi:hypothetical protein